MFNVSDDEVLHLVDGGFVILVFSIDGANEEILSLWMDYL
jgi:hypothetical protein